MQAEHSISDRIQRRQLKWYEHLLRMEDIRQPKEIYQWTPHGRRRGRAQKLWNNQATDFMKSRGMEEDMAEKPIAVVWTPPQNERQSLAKEDLIVDTARQEEKRKTATIMVEQVTDFMGSRNMEENMAQDRQLWHFRMDRLLSTVQILKK